MKQSDDQLMEELHLRSRLYEQVILSEDLDTCPDLIRYLENLKKAEGVKLNVPGRVLHDSPERR